jgi:hypothetical protein
LPNLVQGRERSGERQGRAWTNRATGL